MDEGVTTSLTGATICYVSVGGFAGVYRTLKQARTLDAAGARVVFVGYADRMPKAYRESGLETVLVAPPEYSQSHIRTRLIRIAANLTVHKIRNAVIKRRLHSRLVEAVAQAGADVVQCVELPGLETARAAAKRLRAKLVYDSNELWSGFVKNPDMNMAPELAAHLLAAEREIIPVADLVLTTSDELAERLIADYGIRRPLTLFNAPPERIESPLPVSDPVRLVYHGGLSADRNIDGLIRAVKLLEGEATLDIHGFSRTVDAPTLQALIDDLGLQDSVRLHGAFEYSDVVGILSNYDIGVMTPLLVEENFVYTLPNKLFDCMCAGVAVAMYDSPPMRQVIGSTGIGITLDTSSPETIARDLGPLVRDPARITAMKVAAVEASPNYWWPEQGKKLVEAFERMLGAN